MSLPANRRALIAALAAVAFTVPVAAVAQTSGFGDVGPSHAHRNGIAYVADAGITVGCGNGTNFCPSDPVTRGQMATFLHRASGNAPGTAPSVDAASLDGQTVADLIAASRPRYTRGSRLTGANVTLAATSTFQKVHNLGPFVKQEASSLLDVTYQTHAQAGSAGHQCAYQLRIDGVNAIGSSDTTNFDRSDGYEARLVSTTRVPVNLSATFLNVPAGLSMLELWVESQDAGASCFENPGNYRRAWHVIEVPRD